MSEKELKKYVDEYFEKYMCVSFDKFIENWEETNETIHFFEKENKDLQQRITKVIWLLDLFISDTDLSRYDFLSILMDVKKKLKDKE